jgi:hypothetical protein
MYPHQYTPRREAEFPAGWVSQLIGGAEFGNVLGYVGKRGVGGIGQFFGGAARFADGVMPAVVPVDAGFVALDGPDAAACPEGLLASPLDSSVIRKVPQLPSPTSHFTEEIFRGEIGVGRAHILNTRDVGHGAGLLVAVFEGDDHGGRPF